MKLYTENITCQVVTHELQLQGQKGQRSQEGPEGPTLSHNRELMVLRATVQPFQT
jgi:hypothetical protein